MFYEERCILVRHLTGYRLYPMSLVTLYNDAGVELGSGMAPANRMTKEDSIVEDIDVMVEKAPIVDPDFINRSELATGIDFNHGQW